MGLYLNPPESAVVLCAEREDPDCRRWTAQRRPCLCCLLHRSAQAHDYRRHGTTDLHAALDVATGKVITAMTARHRAKEFRAFLDLIDAEVPSGLYVHIVLDNLSTHTTVEIKRWQLKHPRFHFHFTPTYSPWGEPGGALVR